MMAKDFRQRVRDAAKRYEIPELEIAEDEAAPYPISADLNEISGAREVYHRRVLEDHRKRNPQSKEITKLRDMGPAIAPDGTTAGSMAEKLLNELQSLVENQTKLDAALASLEKQVDPCADAVIPEELAGQDVKMVLVDGVCTPVKASYVQETTPAQIQNKADAQAKAEADAEAFVNKLVAKSGGRVFRKILPLTELRILQGE